MAQKREGKPGTRPASIGADPLDAVVPGGGSRKAKRADTEPPPAPKVEKVRATFHLSGELLEKLRDAVVALSGPPDRLTLAGLAEDALREKLEDLKKARNRGKEFPKRSGELRGGRPIGT